MRIERPPHNVRFRAACLCAFVLGLISTGCIYVPTPHREWVTPPASGRVVNADSRAPIADAVVTRFEPKTVQAQTRTDAEGRFKFVGVRELRWLHLDRPAYARFRVEAPGYVPAEVARGGWAFSDDLNLNFSDIPLASP